MRVPANEEITSGIHSGQHCTITGSTSNNNHSVKATAPLQRAICLPNNYLDSFISRTVAQKLAAALTTLTEHLHKSPK